MKNKILKSITFLAACVIAIAGMCSDDTDMKLILGALIPSTIWIVLFIVANNGFEMEDRDEEDI